jgi:hypothetical protein
LKLLKRRFYENAYLNTYVPSLIQHFNFHLIHRSAIELGNNIVDASVAANASVDASVAALSSHPPQNGQISSKKGKANQHVVPLISPVFSDIQMNSDDESELENFLSSTASVSMSMDQLSNGQSKKSNAVVHVVGNGGKSSIAPVAPASSGGSGVVTAEDELARIERELLEIDEMEF